MVDNPPADMARLNPAVFYKDPDAAISWLTTVFGFELKLSIPGEDGAIVHAELTDQFYGDRTHSALDLEGHRWTFGQHTRDVDLSELSPSEGSE